MGYSMTRTDQKVIFTALGFLAVVLDNVPRESQALRATTLAQLIEAFCATAVPEALVGDAATGAAETDLLQEAMTALELCLEEGHMTFTSEQAADRVITRIKARL